MQSKAFLTLVGLSRFKVVSQDTLLGLKSSQSREAQSDLLSEVNWLLFF